MAALQQRPAVPTAALVTDIGNDLMYEAPVDKIVAWVTGCLDALEKHEARIVMTRLPVANIDRVPEWKFRMLRRHYVPARTIALRDHRGTGPRARRATVRNRPRARHRAVEQSSDWYGWDPIHLKSSSWPTVWHHILSVGMPGKVRRPRPIRICRACSTASRTPERRWLFGFEQRGQQPCARLAEGTVVSLY